MTRTRTTFTYRAMAAALVLALLAVGCSGGDEEGAPSTTEKAEATTTTEADEPTTTEVEGVDGSGGGGAGAGILSKKGAADLLQDGGGNVLTTAFGFPDSMSSIEGDLHRVGADYTGLGTTDRLPGEQYQIEAVQQKPLAEASAAMRAHFIEAGFTVTPGSTEADLTAAMGPPDNANENLVSITLEDAGNGATRVNVLLTHTLPDGKQPEIAGDLFAFVESLRFNEAMVFADADVSLDRGDDPDLAVGAYVAFSARYEVEADGYGDAKTALENVCAGKVKGYSCGKEGVEPNFDDSGVRVAELESPDLLDFEVTLLKPGNDGTDVPSFTFSFIGDGFG